MKKKLIVLLAVALPCVLFSACGGDDDGISGTGGTGQGVGGNTGETSVTGGVENLYITGAEIASYINVTNEVLVNTTFGVVYSTEAGVNIDNCKGKQSTTSLESKAYRVIISGLEADTKYYYRAYACIGGNYVYGAEKTFTTKNVKPTATLTSQEGRKATFSCNTMFGEFDLQNKNNMYGLIWGTSANLDVNNASGGLSAYPLENGSYTIDVSNLSYSTKYYYRAYTRTGSKYIYSEVLSFTTGEGHEPKVGEAVDLGLSVKWASWNVGASKPEEYGYYFAWGEFIGYDNSESHQYSWTNYKWYGGRRDVIYFTVTKYCTSSDYGTIDNKTTLELDDDAAFMKWGDSWRIPTSAELDELCNTSNCTWIWTTINGVKGYKVVSKKNGNFIFLPAAGTLASNENLNPGFGYYWSSSLCTSRSSDAYYLGFNSNKFDESIRSFHNRNYGMSVRAVCP